MTCGVCGVTARMAGVFRLQCEFGVKCDDVLGWGDICCAFVPATLGGETADITPNLRAKTQLQSLPVALRTHAHRMRPHHW
jgi:hypothetical protein